MISFRGTLSALQAGSLREYWRKRVNNLLYWEALRFASENGHGYFDFGRSIAGSGPAAFKRTFRAQPQQLFYEYYLHRANHLPMIRQDNPQFRLVRKAWTRLPLFVTKWMGPLLIRNIP